MQQYLNVRKLTLVQECLLTMLFTLVLIEILCEYDNGFLHSIKPKEYLGHLSKLTFFK